MSENTALTAPLEGRLDSNRSGAADRGYSTQLIRGLVPNAPARKRRSRL